MVTSEERLLHKIQEDMWDHKIKKQQPQAQLVPLQVGQPV